MPLSAHARQRQAVPRCSSDTRARTEASKRTLRHQHGTSKLPALAGPQPFGPPQSGHCVAGRGNALPVGPITPL